MERIAIKRIFYFFIIFIFSLSFFNPTVNAALDNYEGEVLIFDLNNGNINNMRGYYLISGETFLILNFDKIIQINYTIGNQTLYAQKTIDRVISLQKVDNAKLIIRYNNTVLSGIIKDRNARNIVNYGLGQYMNNQLIIAPIGLFWGIMVVGVKYIWYFKRIG